MRILRLTLHNWRTFKNLDISVGQRLVVIGPNVAGKSNLLDSIRFLHDLASPGGSLQDAVRSRGGLPRLRCLFARNNHHGWVSITVVIGDGNGEEWTYSVAIRSEPRGLHRAVVAQKLVKRGEETLLSRRDAEDDADPERLTQTALEQIAANRSCRAIADFFAETGYLHLVPQVIRDAWLRQVTAALQIAVPQFSSLEVTVDAAARPHLESGYTNWRMTGAAGRARPQRRHAPADRPAVVAGEGRAPGCAGAAGGAGAAAAPRGDPYAPDRARPGPAHQPGADHPHHAQPGAARRRRHPRRRGAAAHPHRRRQRRSRLPCRPRGRQPDRQQAHRRRGRAAPH